MNKNKKYYLEILFHFEGKLVCHKICMNHVDPRHYDKLWDWWFRNEYCDFGKYYDFELTGNKPRDNTYSLENLYIQVYPIDKDNFIKRIEKVYIRRSWVKEGSFTDSRKLKDNKEIEIKI